MPHVTVNFPEGLDELFEQWARTTGLCIQLVGVGRGTNDFRFDADQNGQAVLEAFAAYVADIISGAEISHNRN